MTNLLTGVNSEIVISQSIAAVALLILVAGDFCKSKGRLLIFQTLGNICILLSFVFLKNTTAGIGTAIALIRNIVFFLYDTHGKRVPPTVICAFIAISFLIVAFTFQAYYDILYFAGLTMMILSLSIKNLVKLKIGLLIADIIYAVYGFLSKNVINGISYIVEFSSNGISLLVYGKQKRKEENCNQTEKNFKNKQIENKEI